MLRVSTSWHRAALGQSLASAVTARETTCADLWLSPPSAIWAGDIVITAQGGLSGIAFNLLLSPFCGEQLPGV